MISINGKRFLGGSVTIVNGRIIKGGENGKYQKFDEKKVEDCRNIDKIAINSTFADVNVSVSNSSKVEAHFYGEANLDGDVNFDVRVVNSELRITLKFTGNCFNGNLKLNIAIPQKIFKVISVKSSSADVILNVNISSMSGDITAEFSNIGYINLYTNSMSGSVRNRHKEVKDGYNADVDISTMSGDIRIR